MTNATLRRPLFGYRLDPPELESEFLAGALAADKRMASGMLIVAIMFIAFTLPGAWALEATPSHFIAVLAIRTTAIAIAIVALVLVRRAETPRKYSAIVTAWTGSWFAGIIAESSLWPAQWTEFVSWDVFLTVAVYAAVSLPLSRQVLLATMLSGGDLFVLGVLKTPGPTFDMADIVLAYACANVVGAFVSSERHRLRRREFMALRQEVAARRDLELALHEVKTLQGIIPICSYCKNIRTDAGEWQRVEAYVRDHTDAKFSHGICPNCINAQYPEFAPE